MPKEKHQCALCGGRRISLSEREVGLIIPGRDKRKAECKDCGQVALAYEWEVLPKGVVGVDYVCPHCGHPGPGRVGESKLQGSTRRQVMCGKCNCLGPAADTDEEAQNFWRYRSYKRQEPKTDGCAQAGTPEQPPPS